MKDKIIRKESKSIRVSKEQAEKNKSRFTITIFDNETQETLLNETSDAILGCVHVPNNDTNKSIAVQQFCSTTCDTKTLLTCMRNLDNLQKQVVLTMLKETLKVMED